MQTLLLIISFILAVMLNVVPKDGIQAIVEIQLFVYIALVIANYVQERKINLLQVWIAAFIFMIHSEILILADSEQVVEYIQPIFFYLIANNLAIAGYLVQRKKNLSEAMHVEYELVNIHLYIFLTVVFFIVFLWSSIEEARSNLYMGRQLDETIGTANVGKLLSNAMGIILPSLIAFVFGKVKGGLKWLQLIFVIPIFVLHIVLATRFKLLFAFIPYCIILGLINISNPTNKSNAMLLILIVASSMLSSTMKDNRYMSISELSMEDYVEDEYLNSRWSVKLGAKLSPEGIIQVMKYADDYFEHHDLRYGIESSNILYRWVPRKIWPNKPTTLDHWLIRYYENVPDTHSTSSGFVGVFRADFGWFALFFAFLIGMMIARINVYMNQTCTYKTSSIEYVMAAAMIPFVFFFVRSPITSAYTLLFEYFVYAIVRVLTTKKKLKY